MVDIYKIRTATGEWKIVGDNDGRGYAKIRGADGKWYSERLSGTPMSARKFGGAFGTAVQFGKLGEYVWPDPNGAAVIRRSAGIGPNFDFENVEVVPGGDSFASAVAADGNDATYITTAAMRETFSPEVWLPLAQTALPTPTTRKFVVRGKWRNEYVTTMSSTMVSIPADLSGISYEFFLTDRVINQSNFNGTVFYGWGYVEGANFTADGFTTVEFDIRNPVGYASWSVDAPITDLDAALSAGTPVYIWWIGYPPYDYENNKYLEHSVDWSQVGLRYA